MSSTEVKGTFFGNREETKDEAMKRLPQMMEMMESMNQQLRRKRTEYETATF